MDVRVIAAAAITRAVADCCRQACTHLPPDIEAALQQVCEKEQSPTGRAILHTLVQNSSCARETGLPLCQDTGLAVVWAHVGQQVYIDGSFEDAVQEGVRKGYRTGFLRMSVVADPLRRTNTGDNTPAVLYTRLVPGDTLSLTVAPKGFGSENMTALRLFAPSTTPEEISDFIVGAVDRAGGNPCPPVIVGVGLGSTVDGCVLLAKQALLRTLDSTHPDDYYRAWEARLLARINALGIGPQGLGGTVTALGVHMQAAPTHIAGLPCCVCIGCHATRHSTVTL